MNYYNEFDPKAAEWLRGLIKKGLIPAGIVDERSIEDVCPDELFGYTQCHFFAGIGGWPLALQLAGWPEDRPAWTGSCPCQPFSQAGLGKGVDDERHLWPHFRWLIDQCRPPTIFGEQTASKAGREWLANLQNDLEAMGYGTAASDLCAAGVGAPHIRQRLWWVAHSYVSKRGKLPIYAISERSDGGVGHCDRQGLEGRDVSRQCPNERTPWATSVAIPCADGKYRYVEPGILPLAHGVPARMANIRGYGNAIVPQVAQVFIESFMEIME